METLTAQALRVSFLSAEDAAEPGEDMLGLEVMVWRVDVGEPEEGVAVYSLGHPADVGTACVGCKFGIVVVFEGVGRSGQRI